jgi:16S rRNA (guanine527-N7)-methyltransferase
MMALESQLKNQLKHGLQELGIDLSEVSQQALITYLSEFQRWNKTHNLSAIQESEESLKLHILDSLAVLPTLDTFYFDQTDVTLGDLGTGGGLPGIPLAICRPQWSFVLVDAVQKKTTFLEMIVAKLKLSNVQVIHGRIEQLSKDFPGTLSTCISRAFSDLGQFIALAQPLCQPGSPLWAMKAKVPQEDLNSIPEAWAIDQDVPLKIPGLDAQRRLLRLVDMRQSHSPKTITQ